LNFANLRILYYNRLILNHIFIDTLKSLFFCMNFAIMDYKKLCYQNVGTADHYGPLNDAGANILISRHA